MSTSSWFYHNHKAKFTSDMHERNFKSDIASDYKSLIPPDKRNSTRQWSPLFFKFPFPRMLFVEFYTKRATSTQLKGYWIHLLLCKASFENYFKGVYCSFEAALYLLRQIKNLSRKHVRNGSRECIHGGARSRLELTALYRQNFWPRSMLIWSYIRNQEIIKIIKIKFKQE